MQRLSEMPVYPRILAMIPPTSSMGLFVAVFMAKNCAVALKKLLNLSVCIPFWRAAVQVCVC